MQGSTSPIEMAEEGDGCAAADFYSEARVAAALARGAVHICADEGTHRWEALAATVRCLLGDRRGPVALFAREQLWPILRRTLEPPGDENDPLGSNACARVTLLLHGEALPLPARDMATSVVYLLDLGAVPGARVPADVAVFGSAVVDADRLTPPVLRVLRASVLSGRLALFTRGACCEAERDLPPGEGWHFTVLRLPFAGREQPPSFLPCTLCPDQRRRYVDALATETENSYASVRVRHALMQRCLAAAEREVVGSDIASTAEDVRRAARLRVVTRSMGSVLASERAWSPAHLVEAHALALNAALHGTSAVLRVLREPMLEQATTFVAHCLARTDHPGVDVNLLIVLPTTLHAEAARRLSCVGGCAQVVRASTHAGLPARQGGSALLHVRDCWRPSPEVQGARLLLLALRGAECASRRAVYNEGVLSAFLPGLLRNVRMLVTDGSTLTDLMPDFFDSRLVHGAFFAMPCNLARAWPHLRATPPEVAVAQWPALA